jgi:16S rRNA (cytosine1402-N4)-methyltransferase
MLSSCLKRLTKREKVQMRLFTLQTSVMGAGAIASVATGHIVGAGTRYLSSHSSIATDFIVSSRKSRLRVVDTGHRRSVRLFSVNEMDAFATSYHAPVMCQECVDSLLQCQRADQDLPLIFVDGTLGGGGHSAAILERLRPGDVLFGVDVDPAALATASERLAPYVSADPSEKPLFVPVQSNFRDLASVIPTILHPTTHEPIVKEGVDGILLDLGVSSHQIDTAERGFAFMKDGPLDMRMGGRGLSAADICNQFDENELRRILKVYGDEPRAKSIAQSIIKRRPLATTNDLVEAVAAVTPARAKSRRMGRTASLARVFQSLRIVVNQEDVVLDKALTEMCPALVRPGGRLVVLSYHSMEDRYAKRTIRDGAIEWRGTQQDERDIYGNYAGVPKPWRRVGKRQKAPDEEVELNPRARSATLRVGERLDS